MANNTLPFTHHKAANAPLLEPDFMGCDVESLKHSFANRLLYSLGKDAISATERDWLFTAAYVVRDRMIERWTATQQGYFREDAKRIYYLSMEFLMGRTLMNAVLNLDLEDEYRKALNELGISLDRIREIEHDAALGNGGLGRLAACFLDSMATLSLPGYGYGIRYEYGMFTQAIEQGQQIEHPDNWLRYGNPWEFPRAELLYCVKFNGHVVSFTDEHGHLRHSWVDTNDVMAMGYDTPIPGYNTKTVNNMRLWAAKATRDFELKYFNEGNYIRAVEDKNASENLSKVLYPNDTTLIGRELRLRQQYFFVCASLQDIFHRYLKHHKSFAEFADKVAIQLNDTHPAIAIPELMRVFLDLYDLDWNSAWDITVRTFGYTNHTLMPEALETWPVSMFENLLPRHLQIIYEINARFLRDVVHAHPGDTDLLRRMSIVDEDGGKRIRMAHLAIVGSHKVNGVAEIHSRLMRETIFADFDRFFPGRMINVTNGITPRRWLHQANTGLSQLISSKIGDGWISHLDELTALAPFAEDAAFRTAFRAVKRANKERLATLIKNRLGYSINVDSLFDVQIKRIHEYKRQLLNVLHIITLYQRLRKNPGADIVPRTFIFGGKAAPGYVIAKLIIRLINDVADVVNNDPVTAARLTVVFIPNYDVSTAEDIIPAAELSEQISTAGTEASGTGNMKMALNGALTIGTLDGANVEIKQQVGDPNIFIFGLTAEEVSAMVAQGYRPWDYYHRNPELKEVLDLIGGGFFSPGDPDRYKPIFETLTTRGDLYLLLADYASYIQRQADVEALYRQPDEWTRRAILNVAHVGMFSSDRTIAEYAQKIWNVHAVAPD